MIMLGRTQSGPVPSALSAHAASHAAGGTDPVTLTQSQVTGLVGDLAAATAAAAAAQATATAAQPGSANLTSLAGLAGVADRLSYFTAAATLALATLTTYGRSLIAAIDAAAAKTLLALVKADVGLGNVDNTSNADAPVSTAQAAADALRVLKAGDTMSGTLTLGSGGNLTLTGGATAAQGNIQMSAPASAVYDSNVLYLGNNNQTCGMIASATNAFLAANGPYFGLRGNTYAATASQRGNLFLAAGNPTTPGATEGTVAILTGNNLTRLLVNNAGKVLLGGTSAAASFVDASVLQVSGTVTQAAGGDFYAVRFNPALTKAASGTHAYALGVFVQAPAIAGGAGAVTNAASLAIEAEPTGATNNYALWVLAGKSRFGGSVQIGATGTPITQTRVYTPTLTPTLIAAAGLTEQSFTVTGLTTSDTVTVNGPAPTANTAMIHARVSAADTIRLTFHTTGASLTPAAGVYRLLAVRS